MKIELSPVQINFICNLLMKNDTDEADAILTSICAERMAARQNARQKMTDIYTNAVGHIETHKSLDPNAWTCSEAPDAHYYKKFPEV